MHALRFFTYLICITTLLFAYNRKFSSVNNAPLHGYRKARSARTESSSSGNKSLEKPTAYARKTRQPVDETSGRDTVWRAEAPHHAHGAAGGSVYSLQKVAAKNGKGRAKEDAAALHDTAEEDEDKFGTVATYRTAQAGGPDASDENEADSEDDDMLESGQATPTTLDRSLTEDSEEGGLDATIGKKGSKPGSGHRPLQDIWPSSKATGKKNQVCIALQRLINLQPPNDHLSPQSRVETELQKSLALSDGDFAKMLTQQ